MKYLFILTLVFSQLAHGETCTPEVINNHVTIEIINEQGQVIDSTSYRVSKNKKYKGMMGNDKALNLLKKSKLANVEFGNAKFSLSAGGSTTRVANAAGLGLAKIGGCTVSSLNFFTRIGKPKKPFIYFDTLNNLPNVAVSNPSEQQRLVSNSTQTVETGLEQDLFNTSYNEIDWSDDPLSVEIRNLKLGESFNSIRKRFPDHKRISNSIILVKTKDSKRGVLEELSLTFATKTTDWGYINEHIDEIGPVSKIYLFQNLGPLDMNDANACEKRSKPIYDKLVSKYGKPDNVGNPFYRYSVNWRLEDADPFKARTRKSLLSASFLCNGKDFRFQLHAMGEFVQNKLVSLNIEKAKIKQQEDQKRYMKENETKEANF